MLLIISQSPEGRKLGEYSLEPWQPMFTGTGLGQDK